MNGGVLFSIIMAINLLVFNPILTAGPIELWELK